MAGFFDKLDVGRLAGAALSIAANAIPGLGTAATIGMNIGSQLLAGAFNKSPAEAGAGNRDDDQRRRDRELVNGGTDQQAALTRALA